MFDDLIYTRPTIGSKTFENGVWCDSLFPNETVLKSEALEFFVYCVLYTMTDK